MKINAKIDLFIGRDHTAIRIHDDDAGICFVEVRLSPEQTVEALSRLSHTNCLSCDVRGVERLGKRMEHKTIEAVIPDRLFRRTEREEFARLAIDKVCPEGWEPDHYYGSQDSFYSKDGKQYARCIIRRWVEIDG